MTTTDPKLIERIARALTDSPDTLYEHHEWEAWPVDKRNEYKDAFTGEDRVQLFHYAWRRKEKRATAILPIVAAVINEAVQKERAGILRWIARNGDRVANVETACMEGDNLAVTLCSYFDNPDQETDDETGWTKDAVDGCDEVIAAIVKFFAAAIEAHKEGGHGA